MAQVQQKFSHTTNFRQWLADRRFWTILGLGFSSGLPFALTGATLSLWLSNNHVSKTQIGWFVWVGLAYAFKFLWAPLFDLAAPPLLARFGQRRGWLILIQIALIAALLVLSQTQPELNLKLVALVAIAVAFLSASQDIVIDAMRVEMLVAAEQAIGAAAIQYGYQFGLIASGAGALYLADGLDWPKAYQIMAALIGIGMITTLLAREPIGVFPAGAHTLGVIKGLRHRIAEPFLDFVERHKLWLALLSFVFLYKIGDALAAVLTNVFYTDLGFVKTEIASVSKIFGVIASIIGVSLGAFLINRIGLGRTLLIGGIAQLLSIAMYIVQGRVGHDLTMLAGTVAVENLTSGVGSAAFVAYLSLLCSRGYSATQYALLAALPQLGRRLIGGISGWIVDQSSWEVLFIISMMLGLPGLVILGYLRRNGLGLEATTAKIVPATPAI